MSFIELQEVYKIYKNGVTAIADMNLKIKKGDFVFVIGHTACGKSTLIKMLYREEKPTKGNVLVGGVNVAKLKNSKVYKLRRKIEIKPKVIEALTRVGLKEKLRSFPDEMSGGEQQRVCIARAIVNKPKVLVCDEPTGNLDPDTSKEIMKVIDTINKEMGTTIIMATHDRDIVNRMKKRVIVIKDGVLAGDYEKGSYKVDEAH